MTRGFIILLCGLALFSAAANSDTLTIAFDSSTLNGSPGDVVQFFGTLTNTTGQDLFLNADNLNLAGFDPSSIDDGPFFANTPSGFLGPNESTGDIGLFNITIPDPFPGGDYAGLFQVVGGATGGDQDTVGGAEFTVHVQSQTSPVPEPGYSLLLVPALALLMAQRLRAVRART
jgi:hypothetical protein